MIDSLALLLRGTKTLAVRMSQQSSTAMLVARYLHSLLPRITTLSQQRSLNAFQAATLCSVSPPEAKILVNVSSLARVYQPVGLETRKSEG
ncbi:hypothetical protein SCLCIDRAFT_1208335 [Scleroderma citrinum Foug A]|uniref:Uncharacterized protein n=1 Tax=Scleroderma citrinum Foug A TaxID=1036808 RepID=A0A0C3AXT7_9AGAM|nr:hypothetical protein SCLCIDRAFT_1208335 [Scleroderma citrinum Foug A]